MKRLDNIVKQYEKERSQATNPQDFRNANVKLIKAIDVLPGEKTVAERLVRTLVNLMTS